MQNEGRAQSAEHWLQESCRACSTTEHRTQSTEHGVQSAEHRAWSAESGVLQHRAEIMEWEMLSRDHGAQSGGNRVQSMGHGAKTMEWEVQSEEFE